MTVINVKTFISVLDLQGQFHMYIRNMLQVYTPTRKLQT